MWLEEARSNVANEKFPIGRGPFFPFSVWAALYPVKTNTVAGDEIELLSELGQRRLRINSRDHAANTEKLGCSAEERILVCVDPDPLVTEELTDVEEITGAATKVENPKGSSAIEPKILHAFDVDIDPVGSVFVGVDLAGVGSLRVALRQSR